METQFNDIADLKKKYDADPELQKAFKDDPEKAIQQLQDTPLLTDPWIYRIVVVALGASIILIVIGIIVLMGNGKDVLTDKQIPTILTAISSGAIGALTGLLAPQPKNVKQ